ncbi:hypothetical protein ACHQM5_020535 [Ranunculus cassubicifolius]
MGVEEGAEKMQKNDEECSITLHTFSDMSHVSPAVFLYLLKECYVRGTQKATAKFRALQLQVRQVLHNSPQPGPATFVAQSLYLLPILGKHYTEGFGHLVISCFRRLQPAPADLLEAQSLAAQLVVDIIGGTVFYGNTVLIKLLEAFDIRMKNIQNSVRHELNDDGLEAGKTLVGSFISELIQSELYTIAVALIERFSICQPDEFFLSKMIQEKHFLAAEKWATFMGKPMLCATVQKYLDMKMLKKAYKLIKQNDLQHEFTEAYHMCKESSLKKLAEKGCWDVAEAKTHGDRQLLEYLVYLAMEAGYSEKVDEFCKRYSLQGFANIKDEEPNPPKTRYLDLHELVGDATIVWVDDAVSLLNATSRIEECKVVGIDCEWKPNYEKGSKPNKVSIIQIASEKTAFIIDLLTLSVTEADVLNTCLARILHSPSILKLGYNLQCDLRQLVQSYGRMECFKHYEMLLDIQNVFKEPSGGLSGLSEKILGAGLNKTRRNSNWEERPLSPNQLEYAALDAVVLVHIFRHQTQSLSSNVHEPKPNFEWKSNIVSHMDNRLKKPKTKKKPKSKKEVESHTIISSS